MRHYLLHKGAQTVPARNLLEKLRVYTARVWPKVLLPFACIFLSTRAHGELRILVPYNENLYSSACWSAVTNDWAKDTNSFLKSAIPIEYRTAKPELLTRQIQSNIDVLKPEDYLLILGAITSSEAQELGLHLKMSNAVDRVLFVSPAVSSHPAYNIPMVPACLSDSDRIDFLGLNSPPEWANMRGIFVGEAGPWGHQLYDYLRTKTNLCSSPPLSAQFVNPTNKSAEEYSRVAGLCAQQNVQQIFLAFSDGASVGSFLEKCHDHVLYRPAICLLGDYAFSTNEDLGSNEVSKAIPKRWARSYSISMASEAQIGHETQMVFQELSADLISILKTLKGTNRSDKEFIKDIIAVFGDREQAASLLTEFRPQASQYYRYLNKQDPTLGSKLKWLKSTQASLPAFIPRLWSKWFKPGKPEPNAGTQWVEMPHGHDATYLTDVLYTKIPWLTKWFYILVALIIAAVGWVMEITKRYIFVRKTFTSLLLKFMAWFAIILGTVGAVAWLCDIGKVNPTNLTAVLIACAAPMAIIAAVQNAAFIKFPWIKESLQHPLDYVDGALDRCINSRAEDLCRAELEKIENELKTNNRTEPADAEHALWFWWFKELRSMKNTDKARKILDRFLPRIKAWDGKNISDPSRLDELKAALAYTRVVVACSPDEGSTELFGVEPRESSQPQIEGNPADGKTGQQEPSTANDP